MTKQIAVFMWRYFNGEQNDDEHTDDEEEDGDEELNEEEEDNAKELNEDFIQGCQSDTDEEPQKNPYPSGSK